MYWSILQHAEWKRQNFKFCDIPKLEYIYGLICSSTQGTMLTWYETYGTIPRRTKNIDANIPNLEWEALKKFKAIDHCLPNHKNLIIVATSN